MKTSNIKKYLALGLTLASAAYTPTLHATAVPVEVFIEGGSASSSVLFDRATNFFNGGSFTATYSGSSIAKFVGTNTALSSLYEPITLDINVNNGAIAGLSALTTQVVGAGDTNLSNNGLAPVLVDSATQPKSVGVDGSKLIAWPTYVVPLVFIKNSKSGIDSGITNLTQRQAVTLETSTNLPATYYGGTNAGPVYFVGRNSQAAVRTITDFVIYNAGSIQTYYTNGSSSVPVLDTSADPGLTSGSTLAKNVAAITNAIGTVAVQNIIAYTTPLSYEGVSYSVSNVINGSYPLWGYENYYFLDSTKTGGVGNGGAPSAGQLAVITAFYGLVTNATFQSQSNPVFGTNFVPNASLQVTRTVDGGQISPQ